MAAPTIVIPAGARPSKACSRDTTRPVICHAYLKRRDDGLWLLATDSYIACALKVTAQPEAEEGFVPFGALKLMQRGHRGEQVSDMEWRVRTDLGMVTFDIDLVLSNAKPFPDFYKLGVWGGEAAGPVTTVGMNAHLTRRLAQALGIDENNGCRYDMRAIPMTAPPSSGDLPAMLRVTGGYRYPGRIGVQMPVRLAEVS